VSLLAGQLLSFKRGLTTYSYVDEPILDDELEPGEPDFFDEPENAEKEDVGGGEDRDIYEQSNIVHSGDAAARDAALKRKANRNTVAETQAKKIPNDKRATTPYMTKYERARVLGTRAMQIRYAGSRDQCSECETTLTAC